MIECLISPAEREPILSLGKVSSLPEKLGSDILWSSETGMAGLQRKAVLDLIASVRDGRLGRELQQMSSLTHRFLCIEGTPAWNQDGSLVAQHTQWTRRQQWGVELSIQRQGVMVLRTRTPLETCALVEYLAEWTDKKEHSSSLLARPGPQANGWGKHDDRSTGLHVMSGWPGVSIELSGRIFDFYGRIPCRHDLIDKPLTLVAGIGEKRAAQIMKVLG